MQESPLANWVHQEELNTQVVRLEQFLRLIGGMFEATVDLHTESIAMRLLFASVLRAVQAGNAARLMANQGFAEEILAISYTLLEVTVNAAYFQSAGAQEVDRYLSYEPVATLQSGRRSLALGGEWTKPSIFSRLKALLPRKDQEKPVNSAPSWTRLSLLERAHISDTLSRIPVMSQLVTRCYAQGLGAASGTFDSLDKFISELAAQAPTTLAGRHAPVSEALFRVNLCLLSFAIYLDSYLGLGMEEAISRASTATSQAIMILPDAP